VRNIIAKYRIVESNIYNFDKIGFIIGVISSGIVIIIVERRINTKIV
jgi:hypothetical protein